MAVKGMSKAFLAALCVLLLGLASHALAAEEGGSFLEKISWRGPENATVNVCADKDGALCLFLPSMADLSALTLNWDEGLGELLFVGTDGRLAAMKPGDALDLPALFAAGEEYDVTVRRPGTGEEAALAFVHSANQAAMWVESDDPAHQGREWVDSAEKGQWNVANGEMLLLDENGDVVYSGDLREIRGRGNSTWTWGYEKRPYQIKLEKKADLIRGDEENRARTWVLLAEVMDATLLHNPIAFSLSQALGLAGTPEYRPVDLYYDGAYRGYYLLCEKAQINPGRLEIMNYSDYMEARYPDIKDPEAFPWVKASAADGVRYQYVDNLTGLSDRREDGAYFIEMDQYFYLEQPSWFEVLDGDGDYCQFVMKSPSYAAREDVEYVAGLMARLMRAADHGGVDPESGKKLSELLDYDSMARVFLVNMILMNVDFGAVSTNFYLPQGSERFFAGPVWDFDQAADVFLTADHDLLVNSVAGHRGYRYWMERLLAVPEFQKTVRDLFLGEVAPLLSKTLLGDESEGALAPLAVCRRRLRDAWEMNFRLWGQPEDMSPDYVADNDRKALFVTFEENMELLHDYLTRRLAWLTEELGKWWDGRTFAGQIGLRIAYRNADVENSLRMRFIGSFAPVEIVGAELSKEPEGDVPWHKLYTAELTVAAAQGVELAQEVRCVVNGAPAEILRNDGHALAVRVRFYAPFYQETVYDGVDYGLLFNYAYYAQRYPERLEEVGDDPQTLLANYVDYELYDGISGIETFDYDSYFARYETLLMTNFAGDIYSCMLYYLDNEDTEPLLGMESEALPTILAP